MYKPKIYTQLSDIPKRNYQGYYWDCQSEEPDILYPNTPFDFKTLPEFPFILEGLLHFKNEKEEYAISIRYTNQYHIREYDLKSLENNPKAALESYDYIGHRLDGVAKLHFKQLWLLEDDPLCNDMPTFRMKARLFTGFTHPSKN